MLSASPTAIFYTLVGRIGAEFQFAYSYRAISGEFVYIERDQHETLALEESAWCKDNDLVICDSCEEFRRRRCFDGVHKESRTSEAWEKGGMGRVAE